MPESSTLPFDLVDPAGKPWNTGDPLRVVESIKGSPQTRRQAVRASDGRQDYFVKIDRPDSLKKRWRATIGRSVLNNEMRMLPAARDKALQVPRVVAHGTRRGSVLVAEQAMVLAWLPDYVSLSQLGKAAAARNDRAALDGIEDALVRLLAQVRAAGIADEDIGVHNLIVTADAARNGDCRHFVWTDLEVAFFADPADPVATRVTVAGALTNWWTVMGGDQARYQSAFEAICRALPAPRGEWHRLIDPLNRELTRRITKAIARGFTDHMPTPLLPGG